MKNLSVGKYSLQIYKSVLCFEAKKVHLILRDLGSQTFNFFTFFTNSLNITIYLTVASLVGSYDGNCSQCCRY